MAARCNWWALAQSNHDIAIELKSLNADMLKVPSYELDVCLSHRLFVYRVSPPQAQPTNDWVAVPRFTKYRYAVWTQHAANLANGY
jgi:hypothetical protein